jgi:Family of unknown function (DUF6526)
MASTPQSYSNHTRWHAPFHFFVAPVLLINLLISIVQLLRYPGWERGWWVVVSLALVVVAVLARINPLRVQDRLIRLEERLRMRELLPPELARQAMNLKTGQFVALRFAPDEELEGLVRRIVAGELTKPADIKRGIKNWRADHLRV